MKTRHTRPGREGFALPLAVFALVVVGVLVTGGFFMARQESRISTANRKSTEALYVAERGMNDVLLNWNASSMNGMANWSETTLNGTTEQGTWDATITKTNTKSYFIDIESEITEGGLYAGASHRVGVLTKVITAQIDPPAALTTQGSMKVGGSSMINGNDSVPDAYASQCSSTPTTDKPGIMMDDTTNISTSGSNYEVDGDPSRYAQDTTLTSSSLMTFGNLDFDDLADMAQASHTFPGDPTITNTAPSTTAVNGNTVCDEGDSNNWGDPDNSGMPCSNFFPIIYAPDGLKINSSSSGQGMLLVRGDLQVAGGFTFYGPVIVTGTVSTSGTGGHFNGGIIAGNVDLDTSTVIGNALVQYSTCAVEQALLNNSSLTRARPIAQRGWVDLAGVMN